MSSFKAIAQPKALLIYFAAFAIGSIYAQMMPTLSLYLVERYDSTAFDLGVFFVSLAIATILVSQKIGVLSDQGMNRLTLIVIGLFAGAVACVLFAVSTSYWMALIFGVLVFSFVGITLPQMMAHGREYADNTLPDSQVPLFNAALRASFALSWVGGPPIGFYLHHRLGGSEHYLLLAIVHLVVMAICWFFLPRLTQSSPVQSAEETSDALTTLKAKAVIPLAAKLGFIAFAFLFGANQGYIIALPQFVSTELAVPVHYTGWLMGMAAGLEIPIMLFGGWLAARMPLLPLIRIGTGAAIILYTGIWLASNFWQMLALQIFNAVFIGFIAGLGMTWYQDQMPKFAGTASSLFNNAINLGNVLGSISIGVFAAWLGYRNMYAVNAMLALSALGLFFAIAQTSRANSSG